MVAMEYEKKKKSRGEAAAAVAATAAGKKEVTQKAVAVIEEGLRKGRGGQESGHRWMPLNWHTEFKPVLGPYKKFVLSCDRFRVEFGDNPERYTVHIRGEDGAQSSGSTTQPAAKSADWTVDLEKAWQSYCLATTQAEQSPSNFAERARQIAETADNVRLKKRKGDHATSDAKSTKKKKKKQTA